MTDEKLIRQYVTGGSEDAFQQIVARYLKVVYAICLREVRNPEMAQDVTQTVFVLLAQKAGSLRRGTVLSGWLFTTARFASKVAARNEKRRRHYETQAVDQMPRYEDHLMEAETAVIIEPWLNDALSCLRPNDREALLLRYAEERSLREIGERYGITEFAAHRRITRAMEKLRGGLRKRGIDAPDTAALNITLPILLTGSILILPSSVSAAAISHAVPSITAGTAGATVAGARLVQLAQGVRHAIRVQQINIAAISVIGCVVVSVGTTWLTHHAKAATRPDIDPQALRSMRQMVAAYGALTSYSDSTAAFKTVDGSSPVAVNYPATVALRKPDFALIRTTKAPPDTGAFWSLDVATDGKYVYTEIPDTKTILKQRVPAGTSPLVEALNLSHLRFHDDRNAPPSTDVFGLIIDSSKFERGSLENNNYYNVSLIMKPAGICDGVETETFEILHTFKTSGGQDTYTYSVGKSDHMIRQVVVESAVPTGIGVAQSITETHSNVKANPNLPAADFTFEPPAGVKQADQP